MEFWIFVLALIGFGIGFSISTFWVIAFIIIFAFFIFLIKEDIIKIIIGSIGLYIIIGMSLGNMYYHYQDDSTKVVQEKKELNKTNEENEISTWEKIKTWKPFEKQGE